MQTIKLKLPDGATIEVENNTVERGPQLAAARGVADDAVDLVNDVLPKISAVAGALHGHLRTLAPDSVEVEFGVEIGGTTGIIIVEGTAKANITVKLGWTNIRSA